jgi:hypothetical protein
MLAQGAVNTTKENKDNKETEKEKDLRGEELRKAVAAGDDANVKKLLRHLSSHPIREIDIHASFITACMGGNLEMMQRLSLKLESKTHLVNGLLEAVRYGWIKATKWILNNPDLNINHEQIMTAIRLSTMNQDWGIMNMLLKKSELYIEGHYQYPSFAPSDNKELLLVKAIESLSICEEVSIPARSFIPSGMRGAKTRDRQTPPSHDPKQRHRQSKKH